MLLQVKRVHRATRAVKAVGGGNGWQNGAKECLTKDCPDIVL